MDKNPLAIEEVPLLDLQDEPLQRRIPLLIKQLLDEVEITLDEMKVYPSGCAIPCQVSLLSRKPFPLLDGVGLFPLLHFYIRDEQEQTYVGYPQLQTMSTTRWEGIIVVGPKVNEQRVTFLFLTVVGIQWLLTPPPQDKLSFFFQNGPWNFEIPLTATT